MDYGAIAYDSAAKTHLAKLDHIQYQALKIACEAMKGILAEAFNVECDELPLQLQRWKAQIEHAVKVRSTPNQPAKHVYEVHWTQYYGKFTENNRPLNENINVFSNRTMDLK